MKAKQQYLLFLLIIFLFITMLPDDLYAQCSMCRKVANDGTNAQTVGAGLNTGILYLLVIPYILMGLFFRKQITEFVKSKFMRAKN